MRSPETLSKRECIEVLVEEYRSLNALLLFRLSALDRRLPASVGFMAAAVAATLSLPIESRIAVLILTPSAVLWMVRTTIQHAMAKEDHLRRIAEIEVLINELAGRDLLAFQSQHPNRAAATAGRSGTATVIATAAGAVLLLVLCLVLFSLDSGPIPYGLYLGYVGLIAADVVLGPMRLSRYSYAKRPKFLEASR